MSKLPNPPVVPYFIAHPGNKLFKQQDLTGVEISSSKGLQFINLQFHWDSKEFGSKYVQLLGEQYGPVWNIEECSRLDVDEWREGMLFTFAFPEMPSEKFSAGILDTLKEAASTNWE